MENDRGCVLLGELCCWRPFLPDAAPPPDGAARPDLPVVCPGFGLDRLFPFPDKMGRYVLILAIRFQGIPVCVFRVCDYQGVGLRIFGMGSPGLGHPGLGCLGLAFGAMGRLRQLISRGRFWCRCSSLDISGARLSLQLVEIDWQGVGKEALMVAPHSVVKFLRIMGG